MKIDSLFNKSYMVPKKYCISMTRETYNACPEFLPMIIHGYKLVNNDSNTMRILGYGSAFINSKTHIFNIEISYENLLKYQVNLKSNFRWKNA